MARFLLRLRCATPLLALLAFALARPFLAQDDDPAVVHIVPDRTSRNATLPDECLGAMCGRVRG